MDTLALEPRAFDARRFLPARTVATNAIPWVPLSDGKSFKPLRFLRDNRGFVELLRLEAGTVIPLHRHTGEVHAFNLQGTRRLCTGELIGPADYVYEPAGNIDWWRVAGDEPLVVMVVVMGAVEHLGAHEVVTRRIAAEDLRAIYHRYCAENGIEALDLVE